MAATLREITSENRDAVLAPRVADAPADAEEHPQGETVVRLPLV